ncbi:MAG: molybdopterin dinucleotide binding domain-containing protein [Candidatus Bathyarchaeota archaeon]
MPKRIKTTLLTGRTIYQGVGKECGKLSKAYWHSVSICEIDPEDLVCLGLKENDSVQITTAFGSVVLTAMKSLCAPHAGSIFIPYGLFANVLIGSKTNGTGMPSFKGVPAEMEPAKGTKPLTVPEFLKKHYGK